MQNKQNVMNQKILQFCIYYNMMEETNDIMK